jgi:hypothetical protein
MLFGAPTLNAAFGSYQGALVPDHLQGRIESIAGLIAAGVAPLGRSLPDFFSAGSVVQEQSLSSGSSASASFSWQP